MTPAQRAFLDAQIALAAWRIAKDTEAQVAHWLSEGRATREELAEMRQRTRAAHEAHRRAQRSYQRAASASVASVASVAAR
jgi:DNA-binding CsgD family transcriptional regulator